MYKLDILFWLWLSHVCEFIFILFYIFLPFGASTLNILWLFVCFFFFFSSSFWLKENCVSCLLSHFFFSWKTLYLLWTRILVLFVCLFFFFLLYFSLFYCVRQLCKKGLRGSFFFVGLGKQQSKLYLPRGLELLLKTYITYCPPKPDKIVYFSQKLLSVVATKKKFEVKRKHFLVKLDYFVKINRKTHFVCDF
jgi:hypothetical protein